VPYRRNTVIVPLVVAVRQPASSNSPITFAGPGQSASSKATTASAVRCGDQHFQSRRTPCKGTEKLYKDRYRLRRFGRGGFVEAAMRAEAKLVPLCVVGAEEAMPAFAQVPLLQKLTGLIYFPITPTFPWLGPLGMMGYLPAKFKIRFLEPIDTAELGGRDAAQDKALVQTVAQEVRARIQENLHDMLGKRKSVWFG
jgi:1-acyl-sn-glycerol-3-phosphate acyltransferase